MNLSNKEESTTKTSQEGFAPLAGAIGNMPKLFHQSNETRLGVTFKDNSTSSTHQTVSFHDVAPNTGYMMDSQMDSTAALQDTGNTSLSDFFLRPIKVSTLTFDLNGYNIYRIDPWSLFFSNPRVINRICNYKLLRCKLHVKFLVNGNPFFHGRMMASYLPYANDDEMEYIKLTSGDLSMQVIRSQRPHVFLDPTLSQGGEMVLPFFCRTSNLDIPSQQWQEMGVLTIESLTQLRHCNGGTSGLTVTVFVHATDVILSVPTSTEPGALSPQSCETEVALRFQADETDHATGVVSGPASAVALSLRMLAGVSPAIAPYAMASSMVASTVAGISRLFGWSRPKIAAAGPAKATIESVGNMANVDVPDASISLGLDSKNEVTIDPRVVGLAPTDEMTLSSIVAHESIFHIAKWFPSDTAEHLVTNVRVDPHLVRIDPGTLDRIFMTSTAYASMPFVYWTGTLNFRFQILCSSFHKGRLKIVYDPNEIQGVEYNVNFMKIVDISETRDFTVSIPVSQSRPFCKRLDFNNTAAQMYSDSVGLTQLDKGNGVLAVHVVTPLTTPSSSSPEVDILVSVSGGPDFQCADPADDYIFLSLKSQSSETEVALRFQGLEEDVTVTDGTSPIGEPQAMTGLESSISADLGKIFFGESVISFRPLVKRFIHHTTYGLPQGDSGSRYAFIRRFSAFPFNRGKVFNAIMRVPASGTKLYDYNFCNTTFLNYLSFAYAGYRGSIRWKAVSNVETPMRITRIVDDSSFASITETLEPLTGNVGLTIYAANALVAKTSGASGAHSTVGVTQPTNEVEIPFYSMDRFQLCRKEDRTSSSYSSNTKVDGVDCECIYEGSQNVYKPVDVYAAGGDDFSVHFYIGPPPLYYDWEPPPV